MGPTTLLLRTDVVPVQQQWGEYNAAIQNKAEET